jgi:hypothetical protein
MWCIFHLSSYNFFAAWVWKFPNQEKRYCPCLFIVQCISLASGIHLRDRHTDTVYAKLQNELGNRNLELGTLNSVSNSRNLKLRTRNLKRQCKASSHEFVYKNIFRLKQMRISNALKKFKRLFFLLQSVTFSGHSELVRLSFYIALIPPVRWSSFFWVSNLCCLR